MSLDFQQVRKQVLEWGIVAPARARQLKELRERAYRLLEDHALEIDRLSDKVRTVVKNDDSTLRCARPVEEPLTTHYPLPEKTSPSTLLAADGSQINPDRNLEVDYCLFNVGAICLRQGSGDPPQTTVQSHLLYDDQFNLPNGLIDEDRLALARDLGERRLLAELVDRAEPPVIAFTDGPLELWGAKDARGEGSHEFQKSLQVYKEILSRLCEQDVATAGYVDKPGANLLVRLLEIALTPESELSEIAQRHPLFGVRDTDLLKDLLQPGERSAVFAMQSKSAENYPGELALHFFYLNVGRVGHPWPVRVEIPEWVRRSPDKLDRLQAALVDQCRIMGARPYPYLLLRAHEAALVTYQEKEQVTQMIVTEMHRQGVPIGELSNKQSAKDLSGRTRYSG